MKKTAFGVVVFLVILTSAQAWADFPVSDAGTVFAAASPALPSKPIVQGPMNVGLFRAAPDQSHVYLWLNDQALFHRVGTVFGNSEHSTGWLTASKSQSRAIWSWTLPGQVKEIVVGDNIAQSNQKQSSLFLSALSTGAKAVVLSRRQVSLHTAGGGLSFTGLLDVADALRAFLNSEGEAKATTRWEAVLFFPDPNELWQTGSKGLYKIEPVTVETALPPDPQARRKALTDLALGQEKALSEAVKAIMEKLVKAGE